MQFSHLNCQAMIGADESASDNRKAMKRQVRMDVTRGQRTAVIQLYMQTTAELSTLEAERKQLAQRLKVSLSPDEVPSSPLS